MDFRRIDLNLLVAFEAIVSEANVSQAARRLHMSQSALSHTLARMRETWGDPILVRQGRRMEATPHALAALPEVRSILNQVGRLLANGQRFDPATADRSVHLGASDYAAQTVLPLLMARIRAEAPGLRLRVHHAGRFDAPAMLRSGQLDLALGVFSQLTSDLGVEPVCEERYVCAVDSASQWASPLSRHDYLTCEHINVLVQGDTLGLIDEALARQGASRRIVVTVAHFSAALALLQGSELVYTGPARLFADAQASGRVRIFEPPLALPLFRTQLARSLRSDNDELLRWVRAAIRREVVA